MHHDVHERLNAILSEFCDEVDANPGITLLQPRADTAKVRTRRVYLKPEVKERLDKLAVEGPVSLEVLVREAIYRRTNSW